MTRLQKCINDAAANLKDSIDREDWITANQKKGFLDGAKSYRPEQKGLETTEKFVALSVAKENYGRAAYWRSFDTGWRMAQAADRLDELDPKESD